MMNREDIINEYHKVYFKDTALARQLIKKLDYKNDHQLLQLIAQSYFDEALFDERGVQKVHIDRKKRRYAEKYIVKAFKILPICSNVLWTLAKIRTDYGQDESAIFCYREIIRLGVKGISRDSCKNTPNEIWAQINDSKFQLYRLYHKKNPSLSKRYLTLYKNGLKSGIFTLYEPLDKFLLPELI